MLFFLQVLLGLHYLHRTRKVVHRDIKPSNLLVNKDGQVKLADFGMSGQMENSMDVKVSFVGTATYMAPERIRGDEYSTPSDIWSLGISLLELAGGRFPYPAPSADGRVKPIASFWDLLDMIQHDPVPTLPESVNGARFSADFKDFISCCVMKEPAQRLPAEALLDHSFIRKWEDDELDLRQWVQAAVPDMDTGCAQAK
jgi:serine/threonine protein kinase